MILIMKWRGTERERNRGAMLKRICAMMDDCTIITASVIHMVEVTVTVDSFGDREANGGVVGTSVLKIRTQ